MATGERERTSHENGLGGSSIVFLGEQLVMHDFKDAERVTIVLDNLNTHTKGALYTRFEPAYCREILRRCEFVDTPKHGSWLNIAESELSVLTRQCLNVRMDNMENVRHAILAWASHRNLHGNGIDWQFTTADAREKLKSIYPTFRFEDKPQNKKTSRK